MLEAARKALGARRSTLLTAVTVLTSLSAEDLQAGGHPRRMLQAAGEIGLLCEGRDRQLRGGIEADDHPAVLLPDPAFVLVAEPDVQREAAPQAP